VIARKPPAGARPLPPLRVLLLVCALLAALIPSAAEARKSQSSASGRTELRWAPPQLHRPVTIKLGRGRSVLDLDNRRDYILVFPNGLKRGATTIKGGRNVIVRGGWATVPPGGREDADRQAIYIKGSVGTVHLEGLLLQGTRGVSWDAIDINAPRARVQIENVRVEGVSGSFEGWHADVVQPFGGVRELRIDRLSATSNYQGLQIPTDLRRVGGVSVQNVDLSYFDTRPSMGGKLLWLTSGADSCRSPQVSLNEVYVQPKAGRALASTVWPMVDSSLGCRAVAGAGAVSWPGLGVRGQVRAGSPPGGSFVPRSRVGLGYRTPGFIG
jgi:hypothetical protein